MPLRSGRKLTLKGSRMPVLFIRPRSTLASSSSQNQVRLRFHQVYQSSTLMYLNFPPQSWFCWSKKTGYIIPHHGVHETGQGVGKVRRISNGYLCSEHQKVFQDKGLHWMCVLHACSSYSSALPDYVFDEGERQPRQPLKRPKTGKVRVQYSAVSFHWLLILLIPTYRAT